MGKKIGWLLAVSGILIWSLAPVYWAVRTTLLPEQALTSLPLKYLPFPVSLENYRNLFGLSGDTSVWESFRDALVNSIISSLGTTILVIVIAILAGYAFARLKFYGKNALFALILATMALPAYAVLIPLYKIMISLDLVDTQTGITLIYVSAFAPLAVWLMRNYFETIPIELEEAAMVDGASRFRALWTILPLALPGTIAAAILTFLNVWSQFLIPLVFAPSETKPLTVLITEFTGRYTVNYGMITAAGMITMIPPVLIVFFLHRYLVSGLTSASVKK